MISLPGGKKSPALPLSIRQHNLEITGMAPYRFVILILEVLDCVPGARLYK